MKILIIILICVNFLLRIPFANTVTTFDETHIAFAQWVERNNFNPFILKPIDKTIYDRSWMYLSYKPPVTILVPAILGRIFGHYRFWGRIFVAACSSMSLYLLYLIGRKHFSERIGAVASIVLFLNPLFFVQSFMYTDSVPLICMTLATLYAFFSERKKLYWLTAGILLLTKETGVITIAGLCLFQVFTLKNGSMRYKMKQVGYTAYPLAVFIGWMLSNQIILHRPLGESYTAHKHLSLILEQTVSWNYIQVFLQLLVAHWYAATLYGICLLSFFGLLITKTKLTLSESSKVFCLLWLSLLHGLFLFLFGAYSSILDISPRYYLPWYAVLAFLVPVFMDKLRLSAVAYGLVTVLMFYVSVSAYFYFPLHSRTPVAEESHMYFLYKKEHTELMRYLSSRVPPEKSIIMASWPYIGYWTDPINGFVRSANQGFFCNVTIQVCIDELLEKPGRVNDNIFIITDSERQLEELSTLENIYIVHMVAEFGHIHEPLIHERIVVSRISGLTNIQ